MLKSQEEIKREDERFFKLFLSHKPTDYQGLSVEQLQNLMGFQCSEEEKVQLIQKVTGEEIKKTLFAMPKDKSPGPDGYTSEFFKATWSTIGNDLIAAIQSFCEGFLTERSQHNNTCSNTEEGDNDRDERLPSHLLLQCPL